MCGPNLHFTVLLPGFRDVFPEAPERVPRGTICDLSVNPFRGVLVVRFQRCESALRLLDLAHGELGAAPSFTALSRPAVEADPYFVLRKLSGVA